VPSALTEAVTVPAVFAALHGNDEDLHSTTVTTPPPGSAPLPATLTLPLPPAEVTEVIVSGVLTVTDVEMLTWFPTRSVPVSVYR
jgi:hypothetical protein